MTIALIERPYLDSSPDARGMGRLKVDCSRIFGPFVGLMCPWPRWRFARGEPIGSTTPSGHGRYRHDPTPVRPVGHPYVCTAGEKDSGSVLLSGETPLEGTLVAPDPPGDACDAVGEGDGGDVMTTGLGGTDGPGL